MFVAPPPVPFKSDTWYIPSGGKGPFPLMPFDLTLGSPLPAFSASKPRESFNLGERNKVVKILLALKMFCFSLKKRNVIFDTKTKVT